MNDYLKSNINSLKLITNLIENNTWKYLESNNDKPIGELIIKYNGHNARIDLECAELNETTQAFIRELIETMEEY